MLTSPVPVIVYVTPGGAHAASAGTFIVYAAHIAAMAPGTNIGAATPIQIGGFPGRPQPEEPKGDGKTTPDQTTAERKALNDTIAMLRSLAQLRGRNVEWAEKAVREAATLTASDALQERVIDVVASDLGDLLAQIDGRTVTAAGVEHRLATKAAQRIVFEVDWRTRLLGAISDPTIAFILLLIGFYGIIFEFWSPGFVAPGVIGAICLLLALMALSSLPVQYGALALVLLGIAFMIGEAFAPSFGVLGMGGIIAFVTGALFLFDPAGSDIDIAVSVPVIIVSAITTAVLAFLALTAALKARRRPVITGAEQMIGSVGEVTDWNGRSGRIRVHGELWFARSEQSLAPPTTVRVVGRDGLTLFVEPQ
jgi:membrane-bound serine protease (ClpP class)